MLGNLFENRALSFQSVYASGDAFELQTNAGTIVNQDTVFQVNAIYAAVSLISSTVATLPLDAFTKTDAGRQPFRPAPTWIDQPDVDTTRSAFYGSVLVSMLLEGNAFIRVFTNAQGNVVNLTVINPAKVDIRRNGIGQVNFRVEGMDRLLGADEMIFIPDVVKPGSMRGISRVDALKENFSLAQALQAYSAKFFGQGTNTSGVLEFPGNLTQEQSKVLQESFDARHRGWRGSHKTAVVSGGATYKPTSVDPQQSQLLEARNHAVADVARAFNIPGHLLGLDMGQSYASVEQNNLAWVTHCLRPLVTKMEMAFGKLLKRTEGGDQAFLKFNLDGLLRGDMATRSQSYSTGLQAGYLSINDVRMMEDLAPVNEPSAMVPRVPLANVNIENATLASQKHKVQMARDLVMIGFDPASVLEAMGLPPMDHTGLPSVQLQGVAQVDPEDPLSAYDVGGE